MVLPRSSVHATPVAKVSNEVDKAYPNPQKPLRLNSASKKSNRFNETVDSQSVRSMAIRSSVTSLNSRALSRKASYTKGNLLSQKSLTSKAFTKTYSKIDLEEPKK